MIRNSSRMVTLAIAAAALAPTVSACSAGLKPETSSPTQLTESVNVATKSGVNVHNLFVLGPVPGQGLAPGASVPVYASVINNAANGRPDRLTSVSSPVFGKAAKLANGGIELPSQQTVRLDVKPSGKPGPAVVLGGLTRQLLGGESIELILHFQQGGDLKVLVPVIPRSDAFATYSPAPQVTATSSPKTKKK